MISAWHTLDTKEVLRKLGTSEQGLSREEAEKRLAEHGPNKLPEAKTDGIWAIFARQFQSPLIYILVAAALVVLFLGEEVDAAVIFFILLFNAVAGAIQEGRAQNTLEALKQFVETKAVVMRGGEELIVPDSEVVPGDIVVLHEGDKVPADARILSSHNLKIDEAALTGESEPVHKTAETESEAQNSSTLLGVKNMVFKGTHIVAGSGLGVVVSAGTDTVIGKIAKEVASVDTEIPLKANIRALSHMIIAATALISTTLFVLGISTGKSAFEMFVTVVSVTVSIIPEGLPIAVTLILATGVWRMGKRNALVKRLQAVEALGQARVIAVDKTGTITKNEMVIQKIWTRAAGGASRTFEISGVGYEPKGGASLDGKPVSPPEHPELLFAGKVATFCANARTMYSEETKLWRVAGDPTEAAFFVLGQKLGFNKDELEREAPTVGEIPFDYKLKYHVTVHDIKEGRFMTVVGAPEVVLSLSKLKSAEELELIEKLTELSSQGLRVLAYATSTHPPSELSPENIHSLEFGGFFGMRDALREEVKSASRRAQEAGIRVVMITGDHKTTAETLAREALIYKDGDRVITGEDMENFSDYELRDALANTSVFARVTPEHKLRIINAYKARGEIVAMTGDGVNDAPSLVAADLGVSMGKIGTEVAKEASDIVLLDDNFGGIVSAIEEGRSIYKTIKKVILYLFSTSLGEVLVISGAILLGFPLPLLPAQIIWLNFVTDGFFTAALAMEPKERGLLKSTFEKPKKYLVDSLMSARIFLMSVPMMLGTLILFSQYFQSNIAKAWTISLTTLAVFQWFNAWNCRSERRSVFGESPASNKFMLAATGLAVIFQLLAVYNPLFQKFLRTVPLNFSEWLVIIAFSSSILVVEEIRKFLTWRVKKFWSSPALQLAASPSSQ